jgi:hypothetical protein
MHPSSAQAMIMALTALGELGLEPPRPGPTPSGGINSSRLVPGPVFKPVTGRNSPCPCGSGKKYKKCHRGKSYSEQPKSESGVSETSSV